MYNNNSLTHIGDINGMVDVNSPEWNMYGAQFKRIDPHYPYYLYTKDYVIAPPWYNTYMEGNYLNNIKTKNEPVVVEYADLKLTAIPDSVYQYVEGFGNSNNNLVFWFIIIVLVIIIFCYVIR